MPYTPIGNCLPPLEDIRLQHRYSAIAKSLGRTTHFNVMEVQRLIQFYYILTTKKGKTMDKFNFSKFMNKHLEFTQEDSIAKMYILYCKTNKSYLTESEFVELLSLLLKGSLAETIQFCFSVYKETVMSSQYIYRQDVLKMAKRNSKFDKLENIEEYNVQFVDLIMEEMDKDRDNRISFDDYQSAVYENVSRLQFLGPVIPRSRNVEKFMELFSTRPYVNIIQMDAINQGCEPDLKRLLHEEKILRGLLDKTELNKS